VLIVAIWKATGLVTFNGPALLTDFAEYPEMFGYTQEYMVKMLCAAKAVGEIEPSPWWTEEFLDWKAKKDLERPRQMRAASGWTWLKGDDRAAVEGTLIGGCLESLELLRGTRFWPEMEEWRDAIFFFETSEDKPPPERVDGMLMDYENMGVLERLGGLLVGRPMYYSDEEKKQLREIVLERTRRYDFPVVMDMDFGHTAPQLTLPVGCQARIDVGARRFEIVEAAVA
jgi:muramoyltetrapeptide carboxypeptidase LdcA involved in peptidoglycan recycling